MGIRPTHEKRTSRDATIATTTRLYGLFSLVLLLLLWNTILTGEAFAMTTTPTPSGAGTTGPADTVAGTTDGDGRGDESADDKPHAVPPLQQSTTSAAAAEEVPPPLLLLPPPGENDPQDHKVPVVKLGETISFESMGPIILNVDGTTRRIANWDDMTEAEQQATWRRIKHRNEQRRQHLLSLQQQQQQEPDQQQLQHHQPVTRPDGNSNEGEL